MEVESQEIENQDAADENKGAILDGVTFDEGVDTDIDQISSEDVITSESGETTAENADEGAKNSEKEEPSKQEKIDHAFMKKQQELKDSKQREADTKAELDAANAKLAEATKAIRPEIPPPPDQFDSNYESLMAERDQKIIAQQSYDTNLKTQETALENQQNQAVLNRQTARFSRDSERI